MALAYAHFPELTRPAKFPSQRVAVCAQIGKVSEMQNAIHPGISGKACGLTVAIYARVIAVDTTLVIAIYHLRYKGDFR